MGIFDLFCLGGKEAKSLITAPPDVIDFVVVHEFAQLIEANHTNQFWDIVREQLPDYNQHVDWLEANSVDLIFSEDDL